MRMSPLIVVKLDLSAIAQSGDEMYTLSAFASIIKIDVIFGPFVVEI